MAAAPAGGGGAVALTDARGSLRGPSRGFPRGFPRNVLVLAGVSLLADVSSEMIYPLLPLFLATVLGVGAATLGAIEGLAETVSSLLRIPAGWWSDRLRRRKPFVVVGYAISGLARPLVALAQGAGQVMAIRVADRVGKGLRSAPRDALIADAVPAARRGAAFGLHRAADHSGAVLGPLLAWALLAGGLGLRELFLWAAVPGLLSLLLAALGVRERSTPSIATTPAESTTPLGAHERLGAPLWRYLAVLFLFALSTSSDAFLLLRASDLGMGAATIPILWATHHVVKSLASLFLGALSDRVGRRPVIVGGWMAYALTYLGFAVANAEWQLWALFLVYGVYFGATEGTEKALLADLVPASRRGVAFGWFHAVVGLAALPASIGFGLVWERFGAARAFEMGAAIAALATILFPFVVRSGAQRPRSA